jgi:hypothetical protein
MAGIMAFALFENLIESEVKEKLKKAMHIACIGNAKRRTGWYGDDMGPSYTNVRIGGVADDSHGL